jgi:hypothetical protein
MSRERILARDERLERGRELMRQLEDLELEDADLRLVVGGLASLRKLDPDTYDDPSIDRPVSCG